ncbi:MAG TPA: flagellar hook assembly protein FlgD [Nevskiaceae bacterium]|nr:flagellar hook assembly protein FlgD [Nevskiaceae bacterium]
MSVSSVTDPYADLNLAMRQSSNKRTELGQEAFLKLMTTQMQNQDPFKPLESGEFLGQIAQFSTVSGIQSMNESLAGLTASLTSNQTLQAASLVGHGVLVPAESGYLFEEGGLAGTAELPASGAVAVEITDASGQVVRRIDLGQQAAGTTEFAWDGLDESGTRMPEGVYGVRAALDNGGTPVALDTNVIGLVSSVSLGASGITLNLPGMDPVSLSQVREIV